VSRGPGAENSERTRSHVPCCALTGLASALRDLG
jgi:hypothetical protein